MKKRSLLMGILTLVLVLILCACNSTTPSSDSGKKDENKEVSSQDTKNDVFFKTPEPSATEDEDTERLLKDLHGVYAYETEGTDLFIVFDSEKKMIKTLFLGMNQPGLAKEDAKKDGVKIEDGLSLVEYSGFLMRERDGEIIVIPKALANEELSKIYDAGIVMKIKLLSESVLMINDSRYLKFKSE